MLANQNAEMQQLKMNNKNSQLKNKKWSRIPN